MRMAMMAIVAVLLVFGIGWSVVVVMRVAMMVMTVRVKTRGRDVLTCMTINANGRSPGELERNDEHDDQGDEATHGLDCTDYSPATKGPIVPVTGSGTPGPA